MSGPAKVSSIEALEAFRADLIRYIEKARTALEDAEGEVRRTRSWLDMDRTQHWAMEIKKRNKRLEMAEADYYNARITRPTESHTAHKHMIARARRELEEAEAKALVVKKWRERFDNVVMPLVRQLDPAFTMVGRELPKGVHQLAESVKALQEYAERFPSAPVNPPPSAPPEEGGNP